MSQIFELSAALTLDTGDFVRSVRSAENAARQLQSTLDSRMTAAAASMSRLQASASGAWGSIASGIQQAIDRTREFLSLSALRPASAAQGFATGLDYVPYNNYPAYLHEGEAVLTRLEAEQWRKGESTAAMDLSGLADILVSALSGVTVQMDGHAVGTLVAPSVNKAIARQAKARRYG